jgi:HAMP domain-containing protein
MDIRTKLVFALVAASLGSMLALAALTYGAARELLRRQSVRQLEAIAESKEQALEEVIVGWRDRVQLVTSRTLLRESLRELGRRNDPALRDRIRGILDDARDSVRVLRGIAVFGADGRPLASSGLDPSSGERVRPAAFLWADAPVVYQNVSRDPEGGLLVTLLAPVRLQGQLIGAAKVLLDAEPLIDITQDYTGLGQTGETLMARRTEEGDALILNPLRHDPDAMLRRRVAGDREEDPIIQAVQGREGVFRRDAYDYRGREVWAATRYLDEFEWGLVVKVDEAEEIQPVTELRDTMARLALSLSAFAIVAGTLLGMYFAKPIHDLAEVAQRIREGDLDRRAQVRSEDEIGRLAETFNQMTEELIEKHRELERRIQQGPGS